MLVSAITLIHTFIHNAQTTRTHIHTHPHKAYTYAHLPHPIHHLPIKYAHTHTHTHTHNTGEDRIECELFFYIWCVPRVCIVFWACVYLFACACEKTNLAITPSTAAFCLSFEATSAFWCVPELKKIHRTNVECMQASNGYKETIRRNEQKILTIHTH
jgi:hypothetical protein